ncbi:hypothetical protein Anapl_00417 [Anas platyrhynchos]|uniref:Uncharacterized protein n=1 Tax=Anas platyrhynchos TaxID=8839 RepID=R0JU96_ANAPL|nr:hypothetical protein Anapl_00417 [Anas platyrhynchos]
MNKNFPEGKVTYTSVRRYTSTTHLVLIVVQQSGSIHIQICMFATEWRSSAFIHATFLPNEPYSSLTHHQQLKRRYFEPGKRRQQQGQSVIPVLRAHVGTYGYTGSFFTPPNSLSQMTVWGTARELLLALVHRWMGKGHSRHPIQQTE